MKQDMQLSEGSSPKHDPVYKVTIIPRGRALGVTMFLPEEDTYMQSKEYLEENYKFIWRKNSRETLLMVTRASQQELQMTLCSY